MRVSIFSREKGTRFAPAGNPKVMIIGYHYVMIIRPCAIEFFFPFKVNLSCDFFFAVQFEE